MGDEDASLHTESNKDQEQTKTFSADAHVLARNRMYEVETLKAMAVFQSRHERWKAGGPL